MALMITIDASKTEFAGITVKDNFFNPELARLIAKGTEEFRWRYWRPVTDDTNNNRTFVSILWDDSSSEENIFRLLWRLIQNELSDLKSCYCYRIIANGTVKGQNIGWHSDNGYKTVLYYPNEWEPQWGGSTYFKFLGSEKEVQYLQNRIVVFDADLLHYSSSPSVDNILRVSIAFNLRLEGCGATCVPR
jgi:hypothetical protein